jgi:uncharacterized membrane protein YkoI
MTLAKPLMLAAVALAPVAAVSSDAAAPEAIQQPIVKIVRGLEKDGYGPIVDVSMDDGVWEVEAYKGDASLELTVNPDTGKVLSEHRDDADTRPPKDSLKLSELLRKLEKASYTDVEDVSFERRYWEVETHQDGEQHELHVDPKTAEVISDRIDD